MTTDVQVEEVSAVVPAQFADSKEAVVVLAAMVASLLSNVLSGDVIELSIFSARKMSKEAGVSEEEFNRVMAAIYAYWKMKKSSNPMGGMF